MAPRKLVAHSSYFMPAVTRGKFGDGTLLVACAKTSQVVCFLLRSRAPRYVRINYFSVFSVDFTFTLGRDFSVWRLDPA